MRVIHARADVRRLADAAAGSRSTASRWPTTGIRFEHCILATGSRPARLPAFDLPTPRIMDSTGALELPDVPESLLVVGGGYIGLEMGTVYAALGSRVSVVELTDGLLPGVDRDLVKPLHKRLEKDFAAIHLSTKVVGAGREGRCDRSRPSRAAAERRSQQFSRVLVSVGRRPNSDGLGLENTKVELDPQGFVVVDPPAAHGRPAHPGHRRRGGPAACWPTRPATRARRRSRPWPAKPAAFEPRAIPAVVFTDPEIAWAGLTETEAEQQGRAGRSRPIPLGRQRPGPGRSAAPRA